MTDEHVESLKKLILASGKVNEQVLQSKIQEKLSALSGLISEEGAIHIVANELGVALGGGVSETLKLKDVLAGMRNVTVIVKVIKKYDIRSFGQDNTGRVGSLFVGDETKTMRLTFWNDKTEYFKGINEGDILEIQSAYTRENNGYIELHMGNASHCVVNPKGKNVELPERQAPTETPVKKLEEIQDEDNFVSILATIVQAYDPRFFESCPECNKRVTVSEDGALHCPEHGAVEPNYNYVMNVFLDDGTTSMRASLWKEQIQQLMNKTDDEVIALKDDMQAMESVKTDLLGKIIKARAKVKKNEAYNNYELVLYSVESDPNPEVLLSKNQTTLEKPVAKESTPVEKKVSPVADTTVNDTEEVLEFDDEELLSIDELDE